MNILQAIQETKAVYVEPAFEDVVTLLFEASKITLPVQTLETNSSVNKELFLLFKGAGEMPVEQKLDVSVGFSINQRGEGYLRLPEKKKLPVFFLVSHYRRPERY